MPDDDAARTPTDGGSPRTRQALVVRGGWDGHQPVEATDLFLPVPGARAGSRVRVEESPAVYADADYHGRRRPRRAVRDDVARSSPTSSPGSSPRSRRGPAWRAGTAGSPTPTAPAPTTSSSSAGSSPTTRAAVPPEERTGEQSDNYVPHRVRMTPAGAEHPITAGIADFDLTTEQYWVLTDDYVDVLATTTTAVRPWGAVAAPGHVPRGLDPPVGCGTGVRLHAGAPRRGARGPERPDDRRAGVAVGGPLRVGVVGAGKISGQYSAAFARLPQVRVTAVADLDAGRAAALARPHPGARATSLDDLLAADDVDVVLNLTIPAAHADVALAAVAAGKHVYGEKPLTATDGRGAGRPRGGRRGRASGWRARRTRCSGPACRRRAPRSTPARSASRTRRPRS